ncbi:DNA repair protein RAD51 homolog 4 isoform X6 [Hevea brasiliensis]|uniref:DNA repair protein RAD51 homolog 4 isoform X6 n=1 Tax=Hevea brasiliensis TaxID=3981 RepID=UPI0025CF08F7|nr:DNA repair protein RAD51 homolog 4 isoform X6 [Hevea brasiliensis]
MAPLKSLEAQYGILDSNFQSFCASNGIFTVEDFLLHDLSVLAAFAEQEPTSERLKEGITQVLSIIDRQHQPWLNGLQLLEDAQQNKHVLSTGFKGIDKLLEGGLREGQLTELVGPSSSGKTQVMSNILCHSTFDIFSMFDVLHQLENSLKSQGHKGDCKARTLIVDSISSLITPILGGSGPQGHALMTSAGFLLKKLAHELNIAVLVTNHMVAGEGGNLKPALGESWKSIPHVRLLLSRDQGNKTCSISILKHPSLASGEVARFVIDD